MTKPMSETMFLPQSAVPELRVTLRKTTLIGGYGVLFLLVVLMGWAAITQINSAVVATGQAVVLGKPKLVQSLDGGIIADIKVANGDKVQAGQVLLQLDPTLLAVSLDIARAKLAEELARRARLEAEQLDLPAPVFTYARFPFALPQTARQEEGQRQIFTARAELLTGKKAQMAGQVRQMTDQISGLAGQITAKGDELRYLEEDVANAEKLSKQGLMRQSQLLDLQRNRADLLGQIASLEAERARLVNAMQDTKLETLQSRREFKEQVVTDMREVTAKIDELTLEIVTTMKRLEQVDIRAPVNGIVHEMLASTLGGVIAPGATILQVIPVDQGLEFDLRLDPRAIDQVYLGQPAQVVITALDTRSTPKLQAKVKAISPGTSVDAKTGASYYDVSLEIPPQELSRLKGAALVPGMPIEAFLETGERTVLDYLISPFAKQIDRAFRED